jgi:NADH:ubiquinone oxidoreductase subunit H
MVVAQYQPGLLSFLGWNLFQSPFLLALAVIWVIASLAECNRTPFDLAEADSELVAGFNTEYSGMRWVLFALAEYIDMFLAGALFAVLFLGGYQSPIAEEWIVGLPAPIETALHAGILMVKIAGMILFMIWLRWTLPRFRLDQAMTLAWTRLVPIALVCLLALAVSAVFAGRGAEAGPYGRFITTAGVASDGLDQIVGWLVGGGFIVALAAIARRRVAKLPPEIARLTGVRELP